MDFKEEEPWKTERYCQPPWLVGKTFLNYRRSRMAKTVTFWPWWQPLIASALNLFLFFFFFFLLRKRMWGPWPLGPFSVGGYVHQFPWTFVFAIYVKISSAHLLTLNKLIVLLTYFFLSVIENFLKDLKSAVIQCVKSVRIRSYSGPHFPAFGMNTEQNNSECRHVLRSYS